MTKPAHHTPAKRCFLAALVLFLTAPAAAMKIDDFKTTPQLLSAVVLGANVDQKVGGGILGGERDLIVTLLAGASTTLDIGNDRSDYTQALGAFATGAMIWDGVDDSSAVNPIGLGGLDFTESGAHDGFWLRIQNTNRDPDVTFTVWSSANDISAITVKLKPGRNDIAIPFVDFALVGGLGADFTSVGALSMSVDGGVLDGLFTNFEPLETAAVPEPSTGSMLALALFSLALRGRRKLRGDQASGIR